MWTKESITNFVDWLLWWRKKEVDKELLENVNFIVDMGSLDHDIRATQADKPSASSSLSKSDLMGRLKRAFPQLDKFTIFNVADTNSMEPYIDDNSLVVVENVDENFELRPGQIIIYDGTNIFGRFVWVIHRIWKISQTGKSFYIKGDNNYFADGWIRRDKIYYNVVNIGYYEQMEEGD